MSVLSCISSCVAYSIRRTANPFPQKLLRRFKSAADHFDLSKDLTDKQNLISNIFFKKAQADQLNLLIAWLQKPYIYEYWKDGGMAIPDFKKFTSHQPSIFDHFFGYYQGKPFSYFMTSLIDESAPGIFKKYKATSGKTISFDFMIGEEAFIGHKISHLVIQKFLDDQCSDVSVVLTDPEAKHKTSIRTCEKAGFEKLEYFQPEGGAWSGISHMLLRKRMARLNDI